MVDKRRLMAAGVLDQLKGAASEIFKPALIKVLRRVRSLAKATPARINKPCNLVFLLDSGYIEGFKVLCYSIRKFIETKKPTIIVFTNDEQLLSNQDMQKLVSRFVLITQDDIQRFQKISDENVALSRRLEYIAKYTLLKFLVYQDIGLDEFIFLDCDMIALDENIDFNDIMQEAADFAACPALGYGTFGLDSTQRASQDDLEIRAKALDKLRRVAESHYDIKRPFNSGLFYARRAILGETTVRGLIRTAEETKFSLEQTATHRYFMSVTGLRFVSLPIWWNFTHLPCRLIGKRQFERLRPKIKILHYNRKKPWEADAPQTWLFQIWRDYQARSGPWIAQLPARNRLG